MPETVYDEITQHGADEPEQQSVDHEDKQTQCDKGDWQCEQQQQRTYQRIDQSRKKAAISAAVNPPT